MQNFSEIKRPTLRPSVQNLKSENQLRQRLTQIEKPIRTDSKKSFDRSKFFLIGFLIIFFIFSFLSGRYLFPINKRPATKSQWQGIFLSNGQVYFGHIVFQDKLDLILTDIFYLSDPKVLNGVKNKNQDISLIKFGNEIHGPYDRMIINRNQLLFVEDLKDNSKIVKAIKNYIEK